MVRGTWASSCFRQCYRLEGRGLYPRLGHWIPFSISVILPAALTPAADSASNRNEYQKLCGDLNHGRRVRLITTTTASSLSSKYEIFDFSQPYKPSGTGRYRNITSSGMLRRVALVRIDVSEENSSSVTNVARIGELGTLTLTSNRGTLQRNNM
jgi:hypothetical protein